MFLDTFLFRIARRINVVSNIHKVGAFQGETGWSVPPTDPINKIFWWDSYILLLQPVF